jgi:2-C-methyl-D-erythritol 2,4-cyclodiphosphate synthase
MRQRFGIGYDSHVFGRKGPLVLGGVEIENETGLRAHSDGDAVAHAVTDALLGAVAMGDIGHLFPSTDMRWKNADSLMMLSEVRHRLVAASYSIVNVDVTVVLEKPRLAPHIKEMRENIARTLGLPVNSVSIKAKTNEKMDSVGRGKGIQVFAIASVGGA